VPHRKGFAYAVDVTVPESGTLVLRPTDDPGQHGTDDTFFTGVLPPTGKMRNISGLEADNFFFEAGRGLYPHHTTPYYYQYPANLTAPAQAGEHYWLILQYDAILRASRPSRLGGLEQPRPLRPRRTARLRGTGRHGLRPAAHLLALHAHGRPNPWLVMLAPGLGVSGSAQLAITPTP
jgi:hypothetical protein